MVPGSWKPETLRHQAKQLATRMTMNNGFVCASPKVVVTPENWEHKKSFLNLLQEELQKIPSRPGYYKGAHYRHQTFIEKYKEDIILIKPDNFKDDHLEWAIVPNLKPKDGEQALTKESFSPFICFVEVENTGDIESFLSKMPEYCNRRLWGTLSCTVLIPDEELKQYEKQLYQAIDKLEYGTIGINIWSAFLFSRGVWGGYKGTSKPEDVQSGLDYISNFYMIDNAVKTVGKSSVISESHGLRELKDSMKLRLFAHAAHYCVTPTYYNFTRTIMQMFYPF